MLDSCDTYSRSSVWLFLPNTKQSIRGYCLYDDIFPTITLLTSKPVRRLVQASVSPLLTNRTFSITVSIRTRCSSTIEAPCSAASRLSGASGWTEVTDGTGTFPPWEGIPFAGPRSLVDLRNGIRLRPEGNSGPITSPRGDFSPYVRRPRSHPGMSPRWSPESPPGLGKSFWMPPRHHPWVRWNEKVAETC